MQDQVRNLIHVPQITGNAGVVIIYRVLVKRARATRAIKAGLNIV